mgnify:CR=1 FL=1
MKMRIIGGQHKGKIITAPKTANTRPTTDFAKEALFNILNNKISYNKLKVLDLFCGTGNISYEFASRGAEVLSIDKNFKLIKYIKFTAAQMDMKIISRKADVFTFIKNSYEKFDLIFADPPYNLENIKDIHKIIFSKNLLNDDGILIIEHGRENNLSLLENFSEKRTYSRVNFSFFKK